MSIRELTIPGCLVYEPKIHKDDRGSFFEWFQDSTFSQISGVNFKLAQANCSISQIGVLRGIHFTSREPGQSKLVTVFSGKVFDVLVDLRRSSPTYGKWESVVLDGNNPKVLYVPWGVGHGFLTLEDHTIFTYLCDARYNPDNEFTLDAFDSEVGIKWPKIDKYIRSIKDEKAPLICESIENLPE